MTNWEKRFCYVRGKGQSYKHPTHARRFPNFARRNALPVDDFHNVGLSAADTVVLSPASDLSFWKRHSPTDAALIFDANDPYLLEASRGPKRLLRGSAKFLTRRHRYFDADYQKLYREVCEKSDAVVVSHFAQRDLLRSWGLNVWEIKDYPANLAQAKFDYGLVSEDTINIFWEGLGSSFLPFHLLEEIFRAIPNVNKYRFHFVTDLNFFKYMDRYVEISIREVARKTAPLLYNQFRFHQWSPETFSSIASRCDFALIPLPLDYSMNYWKPETKVIQLWRAGLPVLASGIPSYDRAFEEAKIAACCNSISDWRDKIEEYSNYRGIREQNAVVGKGYVQRFSPENIDQLWRRCIDSTT